MNYELTPIARIRTDFPTKFGVPRQSGLVNSLKGRITFEPEYRDPEALRGLEGFSHVWLLWDFSEARREGGRWRPTVRPPRLGGNCRMGVWATRSPFRPNHIGLSSVRILSIDLHTPDGPVIVVEGADLMDGTPIYDIKPYLEYVDSHTGVRSGFVDERKWERLEVVMADELRAQFAPDELETLLAVLEQDPRPQYHDDPLRTYGMPFAGRDVRFRVEGQKLVVVQVVP